MKGVLITEDNVSFQGDAFGFASPVCGELVFNTAMSGYEEILTDPSYAGQIIVFTYPQIGNTGINLDDHQSEKIYARGVIVRDYVETYSNHRAKLSLGSWLISQKVPGLTGVDTRSLVAQLREKGCIVGRMLYDGVEHEALPQKVTTTWLYEETMTKGPKLIQPGTGAPILVLDFGVKQGILDLLKARGDRVVLLAGDASLDEILQYQPKAVVYSNGPGDPEDCQTAIKTCRLLLQRDIPLFGICLGFQILLLALGAKTYKMPFGHHGANHPVKDLETGKVMITSQNHNYAVLESSLSQDLVVTHRSLFDGSLQGFKHRRKSILGLQGHPEASPGPLEARILFSAFFANVN